MGCVRLFRKDINTRSSFYSAVRFETLNIYT